MEQTNIAEYTPGKFTMDLSMVEWDEANQITDETFPIYAHEYCHYIQDISTISGITGFYYRIIDIAELTKITCSGSGRLIEIPIHLDSEGHPIKKHNKLYSYYCGDVITLNNFSFDSKVKETTEIQIGELKINIPLFKLTSNNIEFLVGTYALQEAHALYIQKIIESEIIKAPDKKDIVFKIPAKSLPQYPYRFVDFLFESFKLKASDKIKAFIIELCLDTFLPMVTLIKVLEILKDNGMVTDKNKLHQIVLQTLKSFDIPPALEIQNIISSFLRQLIEDVNRNYFRKGMNWYLETIHMMRELRIARAYLISDSLSSLRYIKGFMNLYPPPIVIINNQISHFKYVFDKPPEFSEDVLDSVTVLFLYMHIFSLATEQDQNEFNKLVSCPLYENCQIRKDIQSDYICKTAPWTISEYHKEDGKVCCYRKALLELGFDQNKIQIKLS